MNNPLQRHFLSTLLMLIVVGWLSVECRSDEYQYLPDDLVVDKSIPTPKEHLGFRVGDGHLQHHQLVSYLRRLSKLSPRISLRVYGYSHGGRPCIMLTITSEKNRKRIEEIRLAHRKLAQPAHSKEVEIRNLPAVINMGYGVHGDESSALNASAVVAYYLAAAQGKEINRILNDCVILLDPSLNPDGFDRFASWSNGHVGRIQNPDPNHAEHVQPFPGGRVNYYWFDLNRDWLPAQHPESQGRLKQYHQWKPNVVLDFHEMGTNSTYFFQPGIPTRNNPLTPEKNFDLTRRMSLYHAKALDRIGSLYMTEERFDDFYMGKGSTYPDLHGSVGILFEQASSRGQRQDSPNGEITFPFTIRNQVTTSLSSLAATVDLREELLKFKRDFFLESLAQSKNAGFQFLEFRAGPDKSRLDSFARVLLRHEIQVYRRTENGHPVLVVPARQPEFRFLLSLIEKRTNFQENIFYDVSTWHLPSAFGLEMSQSNDQLPLKQLKRLTLKQLDAKNAVSKVRHGVAYIIDWRSSQAPALVGEMLRRGIKVRVARKTFSIQSNQKPLEFPHGTVMVPAGIQASRLPEIQKLLSTTRVPFYTVQTGLTSSGIDIGSNEFAPIALPKTAMLIGDGVNRYEAGEVWHLFDSRLKLPLTMIDTSRFGGIDLAKYNTLIMVSGSYAILSEKAVTSIKNWVEKGGNLILIGSSVSWAKSKKLIQVEMVPGKDAESESEKKPLQLPFAQARDTEALKRISGAIFETIVDSTHPIGFGFTTKTLPVFRDNRIIVKPSSNPYANPVIYSENPQIAGYCSKENIDLLRNSAGVIATRSGSGTTIVMPQNPNFRAFWHGTNRLMFNAVFFGSMSR